MDRRAAGAGSLGALQRAVVVGCIGTHVCARILLYAASYHVSAIGGMHWGSTRRLSNLQHCCAGSLSKHVMIIWVI